MFHQENAGLNVEMAKLAFSKGIWSYVCKMDNAFRNYVAIPHRPHESVLSALALIAKVRCLHARSNRFGLGLGLGLDFSHVCLL